MKSMNVVIGMKVVPHTKSINRLQNVPGLDGSVEWRVAKEINQKYLYVHGWNHEERAWILCHSPIMGFGGDWFSSKDFEPYVEVNNEE